LQCSSQIVHATANALDLIISRCCLLLYYEGGMLKTLICRPGMRVHFRRKAPNRRRAAHGTPHCNNCQTPPLTTVRDITILQRLGLPAILLAGLLYRSVSMLHESCSHWFCWACGSRLASKSRTGNDCAFGTSSCAA